MKVLFVEPFYTSSHKRWLDGWVKHSELEISVLTMPGRHWKWRMHGAAVSLAKRLDEDRSTYDVIMVSDMLDLASFKGLIRPRPQAKFGVYFHENQLTYPWSPDDKDVDLQRDRNYAFVNYTTALAADFCWFNSEYHQRSFLDELPIFLKAFPDHRNLDSVKEIVGKSQTMHLGMDLKDFLSISFEQKDYSKPILLWNHRWEYDKNPEQFFEMCFALQDKQVKFQLIVCGEKYGQYPEAFDLAKTRLQHEIIHWGYATTKGEYISLLEKANVLLVTSNQDFFGGSVVEAIAAGCVPFLPDRLAYPEHIPEGLKKQMLYQKENDLLKLLMDCCSNLSSDSLDLVRQKVKAYDWSTMAQKYDQQLINMM